MTRRSQSIEMYDEVANVKQYEINLIKAAIRDIKKVGLIWPVELILTHDALLLVGGS